MPPSTFTSFFLATSSGGAALIGLLFVATSISPERVFSRTASPELTVVATSAFTALVNAFFVSMSALRQQSNIGLLRAWELIGARRGGLLGWLNPLEPLDPPASQP